MLRNPLQDHQGGYRRHALTADVIPNGGTGLVEELPSEFINRSRTGSVHRFFYDLGSSRIMFTSLGG